VNNIFKTRNCDNKYHLKRIIIFFIGRHQNRRRVCSPAKPKIPPGWCSWTGWGSAASCPASSSATGRPNSTDAVVVVALVSPAASAGYYCCWNWCQTGAPCWPARLQAVASVDLVPIKRCRWLQQPPRLVSAHPGGSWERCSQCLGFFAARPPCWPPWKLAVLQRHVGKPSRLPCNK